MYFPEWLPEAREEILFRPEYRPDILANRAEYLLERKHQGKFLYTNFPAVRGVGSIRQGDAKPIRLELGDFEHMASTSLRVFSSLLLSPVFAHRLYRLGKIIGYCSIASVAKNQGLNAPQKTILEAQQRCWVNAAIGHITDMEIDAKRKWVRYSIEENGGNMLKTFTGKHQHEPLTNPCNCVDVGILCGQLEALLGGIWDGFETKYRGRGDNMRDVELHLQDGRRKPRIAELTKGEYNRMLDSSIDLAVSRDKHIGKGTVGDHPISLSQSINYLLVSASNGHVVLSKWAGKKVGERIVKKVGMKNLFDALEYLKELFRELRMGIMEYETDLDSIRIKVIESVYSSGVNNINMKLCIFLAGIIEGGLCEATRIKGTLDDDTEWIVAESKCTANGDPFCEFICRHRNPKALKNLLIR